jgi:hypothetical protein
MPARHLTGEQIATIHAIIANRPAVPFVIATREGMLGSERITYAQELAMPFRETSWAATTYENNVPFYDDDPRGLVFFVDEMRQNMPPKAITDALDKAGVRYECLYNQQLEWMAEFYPESQRRRTGKIPAPPFLPILFVGPNDSVSTPQQAHDIGDCRNE